MVLPITQLKSYKSFIQFLKRKFRGGELHAKKLVRLLYEAFVDGVFGLGHPDNTVSIYAKDFFKASGFRDWARRLHEMGVISRVKIKSSKYTLGVKGRRYLAMMFEEREALVNKAESAYKPTAEQFTPKELINMDLLKQQIKNMDQKMADMKSDYDNRISVLEGELITEKKKTHLTLVKDK